MTDQLEFEAKNDRELLLLAASKLNVIDEKLDSICGIVNEHNDKFNTLSEEICEVRTHSKNNRSLIVALWFIISGGVITLVTTILKRWGLG